MNENNSTEAKVKSSNQKLDIKTLLGGVLIGVVLVVLFLGVKIKAPQKNLNPEQGENYPVTLALDMFNISESDLQACVESEETKKALSEDSVEANLIGANVTPYSVLVDDKNRKLAFKGAKSAEELNTMIDALISLSEKADPNQVVDSGQIPIRQVDESDFIRGSDNPKITLVEYFDFGCTFCRRFHETLASVVDDRDDFAWVIRHLPFRNEQAGLVSECVGQKFGDEAFWKYSDKLVEYYSN